MLYIVIGILLAIIAIMWYDRRQTRQDLSELSGAYTRDTLRWESLVGKYEDQVRTLLARDQVQSYNALEQGMNELEESLSAEILDRDDKIERLTMERDFLVAQTEDAIKELHARLETYQRAQALHLDTILDYERDKAEKVEIPIVHIKDV